MQIYPNFAQNSESESLAARSKRISSKEDFNVIRDPNISLGLINYEEYVRFFNSVMQVFSLPVFRDYITKLQPLVKGIAMKIKKLFSEIENSREPVRASNCVRYLGQECNLMHMNACYSSLQKFTPILILMTPILMTPCLRLIN